MGWEAPQPFSSNPEADPFILKENKQKNPMISNILFRVQAPFWVLQNGHQGGNWREKMGLCAPHSLTPCHACLPSSESLRLSCDLRGLPLALQLAGLSGAQLHPVSCVDWMRRHRGDRPDQLVAVCPQPRSRRRWIHRRSLRASRIGTLWGACIQW